MDTELHTRTQSRRHLQKAIFFALLAPVILLLAFPACTYLLNKQIASAFIEQVQRSRLSSEEKAEQVSQIAKTNFEIAGSDTRPDRQRLRKILAAEGFTRHFTQLRLGLQASGALLVLLVLGIATLLILNRRAKRSSNALIRNYRLAWRLATTLAMVNVLLLVPLITYASFELMVLLTERYSPKLIIVLLLAGVAALWVGLKVLLTRVPMEFDEPGARELLPAEAPVLWQQVRETAARLQTSPPDHIIIGSQLNFYVTELDVRHATGAVSGKTLFLSFPLLKQLPPDQIVGIIGHELGHFMGEDTLLTRNFYPLRFKVNAIMHALSASVVSMPSAQLLNVFGWSFEGTAGQHSRQRELLADQKGAAVSSPGAMVHSLLRIQVIYETFRRGLVPQSREEADPFHLPLRQIVSERLALEDPFWQAIFEEQQPHPVDSHPPLRTRMEGLGVRMTPEEARVAVSEEQPSAFDVWFSGEEAVFSEIVAEEREVRKVSERAMELKEAQIETPEGRALLEANFPEVRYGGRWFWLSFLGITLVVWSGFISYLALAVSPNLQQKLVFVAIALVPIPFYVLYWKRHAFAELVLRAEGLIYTGWLRPLPFAEVAFLRVENNNSALLLHMKLVPGAAKVWKFGLSNHPKSCKLRFGNIRGKQDQIVHRILQYYFREKEGTT